MNNTPTKPVELPKYKIGQILIVRISDPQKIAQGKVVGAECFYDRGRQGTWFYSIEVFNNPAKPVEMVYTYETNCGDAKTKIIEALQKESL